MKRPQHFASHRQSVLRAGFWTGITLGTTVGLVAVAVLPVVALAVVAVGAAFWLALRSRAATDASYAFSKAERH
ncbi:MAG: hypothetical protein OXI55_00315 [Gammaproteobacteria bacterium]|nr:hypothetical protein [Gammaproteobacteria bacterium]